jgi:polysulfide reductase chain C
MDIPQTAWGWLLIWDFFLAGTGAGAYLTGIMAEFMGEKHRVAAKIGTFLSAPLVIGGVLFLMLDLGRPDRFMFVFDNFGSLIAIGSVFITAFLVVSVVHIGLWIWPFKVLEKATAARRVLGVIGVVLALGVMIYPGMAMSLTSIPFWMTGLLPLLFIGVATLCGTAATVMVLAVYHARSTGEAKERALGSLKALAMPLLGLGVFVLVVLAFFTVAVGRIAPPALESAMLLTSGPFAVLFWGGLVIAGLVLPIVLLGMGVKANGRLPMLTGGLVLRYLVVSAGISVAPLPYTPGQEVYFSTYPPQIVASFITGAKPAAFDYAVIGLFFVILAAAYFVATKIVPAPKVVTAKKM